MDVENFDILYTDDNGIIHATWVHTPRHGWTLCRRSVWPMVGVARLKMPTCLECFSAWRPSPRGT